MNEEFIDQIDRRILRALRANARLSMVALGEQVGLSIEDVQSLVAFSKRIPSAF